MRGSSCFANSYLQCSDKKSPTLKQLKDVLIPESTKKVPKRPASSAVAKKKAVSSTTAKLNYLVDSSSSDEEFNYAKYASHYKKKQTVAKQTFSEARTNSTTLSSQKR